MWMFMCMWVRLREWVDSHSHSYLLNLINRLPWHWRPLRVWPQAERKCISMSVCISNAKTQHKLGSTRLAWVSLGYVRLGSLRCQLINKSWPFSARRPLQEPSNMVHLDTTLIVDYKRAYEYATGKPSESPDRLNWTHSTFINHIDGVARLGSDCCV